MRFSTTTAPDQLVMALPAFLDLVGRERWWRRLDQLNREQESSPYLWMIVSDYHWLEFVIGHQVDALERLGKPGLDLDQPKTQAALHFAAGVVEIHRRLDARAQRRLEGQLRDALQAEGGFASLYLEVERALQLMADGFDVTFVDLVGEGDFDLRFGRAGFVGELECKSQSADAGRQIHRKDFYRFMDALAPHISSRTEQDGVDVLLITLPSRLPPTLSAQADLRRAAADMMRPSSPADLSRPGFRMERRAYSDWLGATPADGSRAFYKACEAAFGNNVHVSGSASEIGGSYIAMRSAREDDTSKPWLDAMRKAARQLSGRHPGFIAVQFQDIAPADLMTDHLRERAGLLSGALFHHYGADHVAATYVCGFGAAVARPGLFGTPGFSVLNPRCAFPLDPADVPTFRGHIPDELFSLIVGAPGLARLRSACRP